jgi:hypothetical protein
MGKSETVTLRLGEESVAFADAVRREADRVIIISNLLFTEAGLEALGRPNSLYQALNKREFVLELLDAQGASVATFSRCVATEPQKYLLTPASIEKPSLESVTFYVLADLP